MENEMVRFKHNALLGNINGQPLCNEYKAALRKCGNDKEMLVRLALSQQATPYLSHACYEKLGFTKEYILENFGEYINGNHTFEDVEGVQGYTYQLYVGFERDFKAMADVTNMMWCNCRQVEIDTSKCPLFYISNSSDVHFVLDGYNSQRAYLFDNSKITIDDADENSEVIVYRYSEDSKVEVGKYCLGKVKIFDKKLKL